MLNNKRKIEKIDDIYIVLKPLRDMDGWEKRGRKYDQRGLVNLLNTKTNIEFILSNEVKQDVDTYKQVILGRRMAYFEK